MARSTTIRLPGTEGPDIVVDRGVLSRPRVRIDGRDVPRDPARKDWYTVVLADGSTRSFALKSDRNGLAVVADDGSRMALDPPRPVWETVLTLLPIGLVAVGGLIGGAIGGVAAAGNMAISRSSLRTPVRIAGMVLLTGVAVFGWLVIARTLSLTLYSAPAYAMGQCVDGIGSGANVDATAIRTTPCTNPHEGEVVGVHALTARDDGSAFPGMSTLETTAQERCPQLFASYIGISFDVSRLEMLYLYPSEETWSRGDRQIACIATGTGGERLTGRLIGSAQ